MNPLDKLLGALGKVQAISEIVWGGPPLREKLSVDDLRAAIESTSGLNVEMRSVKFEASHTKSLVERWPDNRAMIAVQHDLPTPMRRYAAVKELCHLLVDEPEDYSSDGCLTIDGLLYVRTLDLSMPGSHAIHSERLAEKMADELVYPHRFRQEDYERVKSDADPLTLASIALTYEIPDTVPSRVLRPLSMQLYNDLWQMVGRPPLRAVQQS